MPDINHHHRIATEFERRRTRQIMLFVCMPVVFLFLCLTLLLYMLVTGASVFPSCWLIFGLPWGIVLLTFLALSMRNWRCPSCGVQFYGFPPLPYCTKCGSKLPPRNLIWCPSCHRVPVAWFNLKYCMNCGAPLR